MGYGIHYFIRKNECVESDGRWFVRKWLPFEITRAVHATVYSYHPVVYVVVLCKQPAVDIVCSKRRSLYIPHIIILTRKMDALRIWNVKVLVRITVQNKQTNKQQQLYNRPFTLTSSLSLSLSYNHTHERKHTQNFLIYARVCVECTLKLTCEDYNSPWNKLSHWFLLCNMNKKKKSWKSPVFFPLSFAPSELLICFIQQGRVADALARKPRKYIKKKLRDFFAKVLVTVCCCVFLLLELADNDCDNVIYLCAYGFCVRVRWIEMSRQYPKNLFYVSYL